MFVNEKMRIKQSVITANNTTKRDIKQSVMDTECHKKKSSLILELTQYYRCINKIK